MSSPHAPMKESIADTARAGAISGNTTLNSNVATPAPSVNAASLADLGIVSM